VDAPAGNNHPLIGLLALPESSGAVLYSIREVVASVGHAWASLTGEEVASERLEAYLVGASRESMVCAPGVPVVPDASFDDDQRFDIIIVPDLAIDMDFDPRGCWPRACVWLREARADGSMICSVCTGSVLLAEAGLLDGLEATTHWAAAHLFKRFYPSVRLVPERILVPTGPEHRVVTSGGSASWAELVLYLIARFCGRQEAIRAAKVFVIGDREDGQLPFSAMMRPRGHGDGAIENCQAWIGAHYAVASPVAAMIERSGLAPRTFKRRFRAATGYTPLEYVQSLRVEEAKHLLETTAMATDEIGAEVGYQDPSSFRRLFKRLTGVTPARYRQRFISLGRPATPAVAESPVRSEGGTDTDSNDDASDKP